MEAHHTAVYVCEDSPEGILTGVYDAWASRRGHENVRLELNLPDTLKLFCEYITVSPDPEKAEKVRRSVAGKISSEAWQMVYRAILSPMESKADDIYRFLVLAFRTGPRVTKMLAEAPVLQLRELNRFVSNEAHYHLEFLRFEETRQGLLFARIRPKSNVLTLVTPHFADRLSGEHFLILDTGRCLASFHPAGRPWFLAALSPDQAEQLLLAEDEYRSLWQVFFESVAIEERYNPSLQQNNMPLRYREFAPEFTQKP